MAEETTAVTEEPISESRADMEAAVASLEAADTTAAPAKVEETTAAPDKVEETTAAPAKVEDTTAAPAKVETPEVTAAKPDLEKKADVTDDTRWAERLTKAPPSWKPTSRELWEQIPQAARLEIHRRESETYRALTSSKESRDFISTFRGIVQPYEMLLAQEGGPIQGFQQYLKTASLLRMGTPQEKAMTVASAVQQFGVPIELLDSALAGILKPGQGNGTASAAGSAEFRDPRVDRLMGELANRNAQDQQRNAGRIDSELQAFAEAPENEYFFDVKDEMADILEIAAKRDKVISLQTAYRQATMLHPEISKLIADKEKRAEARRLTSAAVKARGAAVQVTGSPSLGAASVGSNETVRGSIEAAISSLSSR